MNILYSSDSVMVATCCQVALMVGCMAGVHSSCKTLSPPQALMVLYRRVYASLLMRTLSMDAGQCVCV